MGATSVKEGRPFSSDDLSELAAVPAILMPILIAGPAGGSFAGAPVGCRLGDRGATRQAGVRLLYLGGWPDRNTDGLELQLIPFEMDVAADLRHRLVLPNEEGLHALIALLGQFVVVDDDVEGPGREPGVLDVM